MASRELADPQRPSARKLSAMMAMHGVDAKTLAGALATTEAGKRKAANTWRIEVGKWANGSRAPERHAGLLCGVFGVQLDTFADLVTVPEAMHRAADGYDQAPIRSGLAAHVKGAPFQLDRFLESLARQVAP